MTLLDSLENALQNGINLQRLLKSTGIDRDTFMEKMEQNRFNYDERKELKKELQEWEAGK